jgi:hypothetical protein
MAAWPEEFAMQRRMLLGLGLGALPAAALAQPRMTEAQRRQFHDEVLARDFTALPPGAQQRVTEAFRAGTQARWNAMTAQQRGEVLTMHERRRGRGHGGGRGPAPGPGSRPGPGPAPGGAPTRPPG